MYIRTDIKEQEIERLSKLDLVSRQEVEAAVNTHIKVAARVEAVARIISNLEEQFRRVEAYEWRMRDFNINLQDDNPCKGMEHLKEIAVTVNLYANRKGGDEEECWLTALASSSRAGISDGDIITRRVQFPIRYLTSDDWLDEAKRNAMRLELFWLEHREEGWDKFFNKRAEDTARLIEEHGQRLERIAAIKKEIG